MYVLTTSCYLVPESGPRDEASWPVQQQVRLGFPGWHWSWFLFGVEYLLLNRLARLEQSRPNPTWWIETRVHWALITWVTHKLATVVFSLPWPNLKLFVHIPMKQSVPCFWPVQNLQPKTKHTPFSGTYDKEKNNQIFINLYTINIWYQHKNLILLRFHSLHYLGTKTTIGTQYDNLLRGCENCTNSTCLMASIYGMYSLLPHLHLQASG